MSTSKNFVISCLLLGLTTACQQTEKSPKDRLYFDDLRPILGVTAKVISDVSLNKATETSVTVHTAVAPEIDRDDLDRLMRLFMRQVEGRRGFLTGSAGRVDLRFYGSEQSAKAAGDDYLGRAQKLGKDAEATYSNRQKAPLLKWANKALGPQPQFTDKLKPQLLADADKLELEIKVPYVESGTADYVKVLSYNRVTTSFTQYMRTLFEKIPELKKLTFIGEHEGKEIIRVWLTRKQYEQLDPRAVEEAVSAFHGKFINKLLSKQVTEKKMQAEVEKERKKVYRELFARIPKEQLELAPKFR